MLLGMLLLIENAIANTIRILFLYEHKDIKKLSNLHQCTFKRASYQCYICGLTQQAMKIYFQILYAVVTLQMITKRLLPTSVLQSFLTIFHYHVLRENVHEIMQAHVRLNQLVAANIGNKQKGNLTMFPLCNFVQKIRYLLYCKKF